MKTGEDLLALARTRVGQRYDNVQVPKDNANWSGPWDCAEFAAWVVYQATGRLFGCTDNAARPAVADAYSGAWARDADSGLLAVTDRSAANTQPGVVLIRRPPAAGQMGHIALSDGRGGTIEAAGTGLGVRAGKVEGREWHCFAQIPGVRYTGTGYVPRPKPLPRLLTLQTPNLEGPLVTAVQRALKAAGFDPGVIDGAFGPHTVAAVTAFQRTHKLVADGSVGPATARKLGVDWPA